MKNLREGYSKKIILVLSFLLILSGCAKPIQPESMVPPQLVGKKAITKGNLYRNISVGKVGGGKKTNPMGFSAIGNPELEKAIIKSLEQNNFYTSRNETAEYTLDVFLVEVDNPPGFTTTATIFVRYKLTENKNYNIVLDEIIKTSATKTVDEILIGEIRGRITQEESMQKNISKLLTMLYLLNDNTQQ